MPYNVHIKALKWIFNKFQQKNKHRKKKKKIRYKVMQSCIGLTKKRCKMTKYSIKKKKKIMAFLFEVEVDSFFYNLIHALMYSLRLNIFAHFYTNDGK